MTSIDHRTPQPTPPQQPVRRFGDNPIALFLDFDGTLAEIAPSPDAVRLDHAVAPALARIERTLGGALALVSGRPIAFLDERLAPHRFDAAGLHGANIRLQGALAQQSGAPDAIGAALAELVRFANSHVGIIVEDKRVSVALHWRMAPALQDDALALVRSLAGRIGPSVRLQEGKAVAEIVPAQGSKGRAIAWLMEQEPYRGRLPIFIGDDVTDEAGFETVNGLGGLSVRIGAGETVAHRRLPSPTALRAILMEAAGNGRLTASAFL